MKNEVVEENVLPIYIFIYNEVYIEAIKYNFAGGKTLFTLYCFVKY